MSNLVARAAKSMHAELLKSVLEYVTLPSLRFVAFSLTPSDSSPMSFFHTTDVGQTTNR